MKLLQNSAGNFLNMTPRQAKEFAAKLVQAADESLARAASGASRQGAGFVQTVVIQEDRLAGLSRSSADAVLDTVFVGISPTWVDYHPHFLGNLKPRTPGILHIDLKEINRK